ncbi:lipoprotein-anchoring transpeptidase ErfK/SrfK [Actinomadura luteofluorescens]|uniref:Lipoprotein-anchoring transpeptidase ErfK/SrfK n=1 Tax=Actinomadura luteofluorescens TaxID=46163 RepID=A0A7Y9EIK0_9ACTN|nr:L,D-transpeptidase [Actinomadura luteofluorescens]NYD47855.1 lipoprotein-anchoring transpeptidase ErfK/SrfK [Actinomadura luteofluorescens]
MATIRAPRHSLRAVTAGGITAAVLLSAGGCGGSSSGHGTASAAGTKGGQAAPAKVPEATTYTNLSGAPADPTPDGATDGLVVHPTSPAPVFDRPAGHRFATLPVAELGGPTWVPVVETSGDWRRVLLPSRPNGATGWVPGTALKTAHTPYTVRVDLTRRRLVLERSARPVGHWPVATGDAKTPTPTGRTFVMATLAPAKKTPSPIVLPLGTHSATLDTFGGGPGTVALHGWPDTSVFGKAVTHGCVRVPADALKALSRVPLGSLVFITA